MNLPAQYLPVMPYLILDKAVSFLNFMKAVFAASEQMVVPGEGHSIVHGELKIHDAVIMFASSTDQWKQKTGAMFIYVSNVDTVYNDALHHGAKMLEAPVKRDYGYTAGFEDPFGNNWYVVQG